MVSIGRGVERDSEAGKELFNEDDNFHGEFLFLLIISFNIKNLIDFRTVKYFFFDFKFFILFKENLIFNFNIKKISIFKIFKFII